MKQGKVWGDTQQLYNNGITSIHAINAKCGGYCSIHKHIHKSNTFHVMSGMLKIEIFHDNGIIDDTTLLAGDSTTVPAGLKHRFTAIEDTRAIEIYDVQMVGEDIVRDDVGGIL